MLSDTLRFIGVAWLTCVIFLTDIFLPDAPVLLFRANTNTNTLRPETSSRPSSRPVFTTTCPAISSSFNKPGLTPFVLDIRQVSSFGNDGVSGLTLHEGFTAFALQETIINGYLRMAQDVAGLFEPALRQYIQKLVHDLDIAIASSNVLIISTWSTPPVHLNLSSQGEERPIYDALSGNLSLYSGIQPSLRRDVVDLDRIIHQLQKFLDDLANIISSSPAPACQNRKSVQGVTSALGTLFLRTTRLQNCRERQPLNDFVQRLRDSTRDIRHRFDSLQSDIKDLRDQAVHFQQFPAGALEHNLHMVSTLACKASRIRIFLSLTLDLIESIHLK